MTKLIFTAILLVGGTAHAGSGERWDGKTVAVQSGAATATLALGSVLTLGCSWSGFSLGDSKTHDESSSCSGGGATLLALGTIAATVASVQLTGMAMDGTGSLKGTAAGFGIGLAVGVGGAIGIAKLTDNAVATAIAALVPMIAGTVIGYHVSADKTEAVMRVPLLSLAF